MKTGVLIVAAGTTTSDELGALTMAERIVINFKRAGLKDIVMVTGYHAKMVEKSLQNYGMTFLRNENHAHTDMFASVKIGLEYIKDRWDHVLFCPVDIPLFKVETVQMLMKAKGDLIYPMVGKRSGHPIRISGWMIPDILNYQGRDGLRGALRTLPVEVTRIELEDEGAITNVRREKHVEHLVDLHNAGLMRPDVHVALANKKTFFDAEFLNLLKRIEYSESVKDACDKAGISYSKGWSMIHLAEEEIGFRIVERQQGGKTGGTAHISLRGKKFMEAFEQYEEHVLKIAKEFYDQYFGDMNTGECGSK